MLLIILNLHRDTTLTQALLFLHFEGPQRCDIPVFGTSRYQARYSSRALRFASSRSRLKIGFTTLAAPAAARVAAVDAMTAVVVALPVALIRWGRCWLVPPSGDCASTQETSIHSQSVGSKRHGSSLWRKFCLY